MPQTDTEHPPALGQALGSRMGQGRGQDTDEGMETGTAWCLKGRGASLLLGRGGGGGEEVSGKVPREHSSIFMV